MNIRRRKYDSFMGCFGRQSLEDEKSDSRRTHIAIPFHRWNPCGKRYNNPYLSYVAEIANAPRHLEEAPL